MFTPHQNFKIRFRANLGILFALITTLTILLGSCSSTLSGSGQSEDTLAPYISLTPGPRVLPQEGFLFRFTREYANPGGALTVQQMDQFFQLEPKTAVRGIWKDGQTLLVQPEKGTWPQGTQYQGWLNLSKLEKIYPGTQEGGGRDRNGAPANDSDLIISFTSEIAVQGVYDSSFTLTNIPRLEAATSVASQDSGSNETKTGGEALHAQLHVRLAIPPTEQDLQEAEGLSFLVDGKPVGTRIHLEKDAIIITSTDPIARGDRSVPIALDIPKNYLSMPQSWRAQWSVPPKHDLRLESVQEGDDLELVFSEELDAAQGLSGSIFTTPETSLVMEIRGNRVLITSGLERGRDYQLTITPTLRSMYGSRLPEELTFTVGLPNQKPQMEFLQSGWVLTSSADSKIYIRTMNLRGVTVEVNQVFENNLAQFLQTESLAGPRDRSQEFDGYAVRRVGRQVAFQELEIGETENEWLVHQLDLSKLIPRDNRGIYLVALRFDREQMIWDSPEEEEYYYGEDYYQNPASWGYLYQNGQRFKPLVTSDIGITFKESQSSGLAAITNLITGQPINHATVEVRNFQNQIIAQGTSDEQGLVILPWDKGGTRGDSDAFLVTAESRGQQAILPVQQFQWNLSGFPTGGQSEAPDGLRAYLFTERGVYRPGDPVHLTAIIRNRQGSFPEDHPVTLRVYNPRGQLHREEVNSQSTDGLYRFTIPTLEVDPTGTYRAVVEAGDSSFSQMIRVETILPDRLRLQMRIEPTALSAEDETALVIMNSEYLFGSPAAGLESEISLTLEDRPLSFDGYRDFTFTNQNRRSEPYSEVLYSGPLDDQGEIKVDFPLPELNNPPGALVLGLSGRVTEPGGRSVRGSAVASYDPYPAYVGIRTPDFDFGYAPMGEESKFQVVLLDPQGEPVENQPLQYRLYKNERYWWWEYDSYRDFRLSYKTDRNTQLVSQGSLITKSLPEEITLVPEEWGEYLLEVEYPGGHLAGIFFRASSWSNSGESPDSGIMELKSDKQEYAPGDTAILTLPSSEEARLLVTLEHGNRILDAFWQQAGSGQSEIRIPITKDHAPGVYVSVSAILPHSKAAAGQALRLYGVTHLGVSDPNTRIGLSIAAPEVLEPESVVKVQVQTQDRRQGQIVLALVDEGLLNLTNFPTPNPWQFFYGKLRLGVRTGDLFEQVIGAFHDSVYRRFSIGGGDAEESLAGRSAAPMMEMAMDKAGGQEERGLQFEPLSLVAGPFTTDEAGRVEAEFHIPNYLGSVRIMAIALNQMAFGSTHIDRPVQRPLITLPSPPRFLGPGDQIELPVSLIPLDQEISQVDLRLVSRGILTPASQSRKIDLSQNPGGETVFFSLTAPPAIGIADLELQVSYRDGQGTFRVDTYPMQLDVQPSTPQLTRTDNAQLGQGESQVLSLLGDGLPGTNELSLAVSTVPNLNLEERLAWLVAYPYGCIEQTVSAVFPQLYLADLVDPQVLQGRRSRRGRLPAEAAIRQNIEDALARLTRFQLPNGGFSYWPGQSEASPWGTNYAGNFLLEAQTAGYQLPPGMLESWLRFQKTMSRSTREDMTNRVYRLYLLAKAGKPEIGPMNLIRETTIAELTNPERWLLAGSYKLSGLDEVSKAVLGNAPISISTGKVAYPTYGSPERDTALILEQALILGHQTTADRLFEDLSQRFASSNWYSTQTLGYGLAAIGKYLGLAQERTEKTTSPSSPTLRLTLPSGIQRQLVLTGIRTTIDLTPAIFGSGNDPGVSRAGSTPAAETTLARRELSQPIEIRTEYLSGGANRLFTRLTWSGQSITSEDQEISRKMTLGVTWFDSQGKQITVERLPQGQEFYGLIRLGMNQRGDRLEEVFLDFGIPGGWEIVPTRLTGESAPVWAGNLNHGTTNFPVEFQDIRDDRSVWFFDTPWGNQSMLMLVKLQAVTPGSFRLPPITAGGMYDNSYHALYPGGLVQVRSPDNDQH